MVEAPIFEALSNFRNVLDCQAKILEAAMDRTHVFDPSYLSDSDSVAYRAR